MTDSTEELSDLDFEKMQAIRQIATSIGAHQMVKRDGLPGSTCRNHVCAEKGTIFLTRGDIYHHQSVVAVNDLLHFLRFDREIDLADEGVSKADMEQDFTYSALTDLLDAAPAGRSYADRRKRAEALSFDGLSMVSELATAAQSTGTAARVGPRGPLGLFTGPNTDDQAQLGPAVISGLDAYLPGEGANRND